MKTAGSTGATRRDRLDDRGFDLRRPHEATPEEIATFRRSYEESKGYSLPGFEFWLDVRPELVKRHRSMAVQIPAEASAPYPLPAVLAVLHYYAIVGYEDGVEYEIHLGEHLGASSDDVWDTLAFAFIHAGPRGMRAVSVAADAWKQAGPSKPRDPGAFPPHWSSDLGPILSGIDHRDGELRPGEADAIVRWYEDSLGEVPRHVRFLHAHRPHLLKAWRSRYESAFAGGLPVQMAAYFMLHLNVHLARPSGIREAVLLARHLGMTDEEVRDAVGWSIFYGGVDAIDVAAGVLEDLGI